MVSGGATFSGAVVNSGNITGTAGTAINAQSVATPNDRLYDHRPDGPGTIAGAIKLSPFADVVNVTGGAINGNIVGNNAAAEAGETQVNFALGSGTFTYGSAFSISGVNQINVNSGLVILDGTNSAANVAVNGGTLEVGDISHPGALLTAANGLTIGAGGTLAGHGTVAGSIAIPSGATLAPGGFDALHAECSTARNLSLRGRLLLPSDRGDGGRPEFQHGGDRDGDHRRRHRRGNG